MNDYILYIARNLDGTLRLFDAYPTRKEKKWTPQNNRLFEYLEIDKEAFPDIKWEDNPKKLKVTYESN